MSLSSSSLSVSSFRRGIGEENNANPSLTGMFLGLQRLEERIIATTLPSISDMVGCDITIEDIQLAKQELIKQKADLTKDVNERQTLTAPYTSSDWQVTPLIHFCKKGNLLLVRILFLLGAECTQQYECRYRFPMFAAAESGHLDICQWLFKHGGAAKYQINKETSCGDTALRASYLAWRCGIDTDKEGKTWRWLLRNGGGQQYSSDAMRRFMGIDGTANMNSNLLVLWMRENIQWYDTFLLFLCGANTTIATSSLSGFSGGTRRRKRQMYQEKRSLQILDGHPGIMEGIGDYVGVIRGKECRMLQEFNELVIEHTTTDESSSDDDNGENQAFDRFLFTHAVNRRIAFN